MRIVLIIVVAAALIAAGYHLGQGDRVIAAGFYRPLDVAVSLIALAAIGVLAGRYANDGWIIAAVGFAAAMGAAALTPQGLELPRERELTVVTLLAIGLLGAWSKKPQMAYIAIAVGLAGATHGHALTDGVGGASNAKYLAGFAMGSGAAILAGMAIAQGADRMDGSISMKIAAGVAGIGTYLTARQFGVL